MNEMYNMSIVAHNWGVMLVLGAIAVNVFMILGIKSRAKYERAHLLFMPLGMTAIGAAVFTGVVMMAAKHLDFTLENIAMIITAGVLVYLELKRSKRLNSLDKKDPLAFLSYKNSAFRYLATETVLTLAVSFWMWM